MSTVTLLTTFMTTEHTDLKQKVRGLVESMNRSFVSKRILRFVLNSFGGLIIDLIAKVDELTNKIEELQKET